MSFYGNIKRVQSSPYVFDKIYSTRKEMEENASTDNVYIGRYVLVKYTNNDVEKYVKNNNNQYVISNDYQHNVDEDIQTYGDTFDSTVWQKIYTNTPNSIEKYILIAELKAAVPRLDITPIAPKIQYYSTTAQETTEEWNSISTTAVAASEEYYLFEVPDILHLDVGKITDDFYGKTLIENPAIKNVLFNSNELLQPSSVTAETWDSYTPEQKSHAMAMSPDYNYMRWTNYYQGSSNTAIEVSSTANNALIDTKKLDTKLYAFGQMVSDLYDILYGIPQNGVGTRPFFTDDLTAVLSNYDKGLIGILSSIATEAKGNPSQDMYGRTLQPGLHYYFNSKWCDATEDPDSFIENIPEVIGSSEEYNNNKSHYYINNNWEVFKTNNN